MACCAISVAPRSASKAPLPTPTSPTIPAAQVPTKGEGVSFDWSGVGKFIPPTRLALGPRYPWPTPAEAAAGSSGDGGPPPAEKGGGKGMPRVPDSEIWKLTQKGYLSHTDRWRTDAEYTANCTAQRPVGTNWLQYSSGQWARIDGYGERP